MGKGDKKTKRGKITIGSYGVSRPRRKKVALIAEVKEKPIKVKKAEKVTESEEKPKRGRKKKEE